MWRDFWDYIGRGQTALLLLVVGVVSAAAGTYVAQVNHCSALATAAWLVAGGLGGPFLFCAGTLFVVWRRTLKAQRDEARTVLRHIDAELQGFKRPRELAERIEPLKQDAQYCQNQGNIRVSQLQHEKPGDEQAAVSAMASWLNRPFKTVAQHLESEGQDPGRFAKDFDGTTLEEAQAWVSNGISAIDELVVRLKSEQW